MESVFEYPDLKQYTTALYAGQMIYFENFTTNDIFILVKGTIEVYLSERLITVATEPGTVLLDIVKLLDSYNNVGVKSLTATEIIRISVNDIEPLIDKYPDFSKIIAKSLVKKITEPQSIVYDCNTFSDQLPDAIVVVDNSENIFSINEVAESLFGYIKEELEMKPVSKLFSLMSDYRAIIGQITENTSLREQIISVEHPSKGRIYISISITSLIDSKNISFGYILICRDITKAKEINQKYTTSVKALIPLLVLLFMGMIVFAYVLPQAFKGYEVFDARKETFQEQVKQDFSAMVAIANPVLAGNESEANAKLQLEAYFSISLPHHLYYQGLVVLDDKKKVIYTMSLNNSENVPVKIGSSYSEFNLKSKKDSIHSVISSYHVSKMNPQGKRYTELIFPIKYKEELHGWFIFIMNMDNLNKTLKLQENDLKEMHIREN